MAKQPRTLPPTSDITVTELKQICEQVASDTQASAKQYQPTVKQLFFFALIWASKQARRNLQKMKGDENLKQKIHFALHQPEDRFPGLNRVAATHGVQVIAAHLADWGSQVYGLQQGNIKEWEGLRIQMEKSIHRYRGPQEIKEDAIQEAQFKVIEILERIPKPEDVEKLEVLKREPKPEEVRETDIFSFFQKQQARLSGAYDFSTPFYSYAKVIAQHKFIDKIKAYLKEKEWLAPWPLDEFEEILAGEEMSIEEEEAREAQLLQLRIDLANLLALIPSALTRKRRQVVWATLARRKQFWLALEIAALEPPDYLQRHLADTSDASIAKDLSISEKGVNVHRSNAKDIIETHDPILAKRLALLMDPYLSKKLGLS